MKRNKRKIGALLTSTMLAVSMLAGCGAPKIALSQETVTLELGAELSENAGDYVTFEEGVSEEKKAEVLQETVLDLSKVDAEAVGEYEATITYKKTSFTFTVAVQDTTAPQGVLFSEILETLTGTEVKAVDLVTDIADEQDVTVEFVISSVAEADFPVGDEAEETVEPEEEEVSAEESAEDPIEDAEEEVETTETEKNTDTAEETSEVYTFDMAGKYEIIIRLTDASGNVTDLVQKAVVTDPDTTAPVLAGMKNRTVYIGANVDYLKGVTATDDVDGDLTAAIEVDSSAVDTKKAGIYPVIYKVKDASGNESVETVKVTVAVKPAEKPVAPPAAPENSGSSDGGGSHSSSGGSSSSSGDSGSSSSGGSSGSSDSGSSSGGGTGWNGTLDSGRGDSGSSDSGSSGSGSSGSSGGSGGFWDSLIPDE